MLHGKQKIWFLAGVLADEREVTSDGDPVALHPRSDLNDNYSKQDFIDLLNKLENDNIAKLLNNVPTDQTFGKYLIELLPGFDGYLEKLQENPEYLDWSGKKPKPKNYFSPERRVDFSKSKEENMDKYISVGQIEELMKMPNDERAKIEKHSLSKEQLDDITEFQDNLKDVSKMFKQKTDAALSGMIPKINFADAMSVNTSDFTPPPNYQAQSVGLLKQLVEQQKQDDKPDNKAVLTVTYTSSRQVVLNGFLQLANPNLNGVNDLVFSYLFQNPGKSVTKKQLEKIIDKKITKTLHKIIENLGFKGDLAKAFFSVSKNDILFRNPITRDELNEMGLGFLKVNR